MRPRFQAKLFLCLLLLCWHTAILSAPSKLPLKKGEKNPPQTEENFFKKEKIDLEADELEFDKSQNLNASKNVIIKYQNHVITSEEFQFKAKNKEMIFNAPLEWQQGKHHMKLGSLNYSLDTYTGTATSLDAQIEIVHITGEKVDVSSNKIIITNGVFSTCPLPDPHFALHSKKMVIYPLWGYLIMYDSYVKTPFLPFSLYVPTYIYGSKEYGLAAQATLIPDIGRNKSEGFFIKSRIGYQVNPQFKGTIGIGYTDEVGAFVGASNSYRFIKNHSLDSQIQFGSLNHVEGHVKYYIDLKPRIEILEKNLLITDIIANFAKTKIPPLGQVSVVAQHRELENDIRVSKWPEFEAALLETKLPHIGMQLNANLTYGLISEEIPRYMGPSSLAGRTQWKTGIKLGLSREDILSKKIALQTSLQGINNYYEDQQQWERYFARFGLKYKWTVLNPEIAYTQLLIPMKGQSPFYYENRLALVSNEIGGKISHEFGTRFSLGSEANYNLQTQEFRTIDYYTKIKFHCWRLMLKWQSQQGAFSFGVELL